MRTIIIDDERLAREELKSLLKNYAEIEIISEAKNGEEGVQLINELNPDLIFLDVNMPGLSGFDLLKQLDEIPLVVFVTAYDEYAIKAFEVDALDYMLKPVDPERLNDALKKITARFVEDNIPVETAFTDVQPKKVLSATDSVFIRDGEKCWFVELSSIRMLESEGNYVKVHFDQFRPLILRSLGSFEERLDPDYFFRANRKFIINLKWIEKIENWFNGGLIVELKTGEKVEISRRQAIRFRELWSL
ncbi:response regulator transcription factor [Crocinitomicaceae bacterium CZZ-1]|uniref:Response regulator transcription factor n=1 Tax=Taishania pollutisoli TaxID=2766479 RepID=A0A8J6TTP4_9FLAO|nr:response regulator transcription factor [Taishania pollutisoli]MBX2950399.1 response regulator transcription factor [Crocinitomicaceae bacterium]NGF76359.1 response regulator transcription factor [Fluviicola sp. SGL-29]